jgi:hypothetical protein
MRFDDGSRQAAVVVVWVLIWSASVFSIPGSPSKAASHHFEDGSSPKSPAVSLLVAARLRERAHCERPATSIPLVGQCHVSRETSRSLVMRLD